MEDTRRDSFSSKQIPIGSAPLASFEDLPSDELESPEDTDYTNDTSDYTSHDKNMRTKSLSGPSGTLDTSETLTASTQSTPQVDIDFDSQFTLTPSDHSSIPLGVELRTSSLSSLSKEHVSMSKQKKGSVVSLGNYEESGTNYEQRKSSWTDIFRSHNQIPNDSSEFISSRETKGKTMPRRKSKADISRKDAADLKSKDKGKFLSLFKVGKKSSKHISSTIDDSDVVSDLKKDVEDASDSLVDKTRIPDGKENEQPKHIELHPIQAQNDLDKASINNVNSIKESDSKEVELPSNLNIAEKEYNILSIQRETIVSDKPIKKEEPIAKDIEDYHESSESERDLSLIKRDEDDFEAENLLEPDTSEIEDDTLDFNPVFKVPVSVTKTLKHRSEVTTIPVDRPRCITPINVAPLEAFIRAASPSFDPKVEKIKLSLPGEQFLGRLKSPKKSRTKSWTDFCEEVLHSPRAQKRTDDFSENIDSAFTSSIQSGDTPCWDKFDVSDSQWVTFETGTKVESVPDIFKDLPKANGNLCPSPSNDTQINGNINCSCQCHFQGCDNTYTNLGFEDGNNHSPISEHTVYSDKCQCQCHTKYLEWWSSSATPDDPFCDKKTSELPSDFIFSSEKNHH